MTLPRSIRLAALSVALLLAGCTQHRTITKDKQPCAAECAQSQNACVSGCAVDKGNPEVLEDVRENLCEKRCKEGYEDCMLACL